MSRKGRKVEEERKSGEIEKKRRRLAAFRDLLCFALLHFCFFAEPHERGLKPLNIACFSMLYF